MRQSDIKLTMTVYTDPKLLDMRDALDALPALPLQGDQIRGEAIRMIGTDDEAARNLYQRLYRPGTNRYKPSQRDKTAGAGIGSNWPHTVGASGCSVHGKGRLSSPDSRPSMSGRPATYISYPVSGSATILADDRASC
jgi:hypothetical protein